MIINTAERIIFTAKIQSDPTFKGAFPRSLSRAAFIHHLGGNKEPLTFCKERFLTMPVVIYTNKDFYLIDSLNEKIEHLKQSGLIDFWQRKYFDERVLKNKEQKVPKVITMSHVMGSIQILLIGYVISLIGFIIERKFPSMN